MKLKLQCGKSRAAFTLLELMVVGALIVLIMGASVPSIRGLMRKEGFRKVVDDVMQVCAATRERAILRGQTAEVVFYPFERRCSGGGKTAHWGNNVEIEMLDINLWDCRAVDVAKVRFFPDGRCDELIFSVVYSDKNGQQMKTFFTEVTTGLVSAEEDAGRLGR